MPRYHYRALNKEGKWIKGEWIASNIHELEQRLSRSGLELIDAKRANRRLFFWEGISHLHDLMDFCFYLEHMIESDIPLLEGLREMQESLPSSALKNVISNITDGVENGKTLSEAVAVYPNFFGAIFAPLLAAGEKTGHMSKVVRHLYEYIEWRVDFYSKIRKIMTYPMISLFFISIAFITIFIWVVPEMRRFFAGLQLEMPWYTQSLLVVSDFIVHYGLYAIIFCLLSIISIFVAYIEIDAVKVFIHRILLKIPILGIFILKLSMLRFFKVMHLSISSGLSFLSAIELAIPVVSNGHLVEKISFIYNGIQRGMRMSEAFKKTEIFDPLIIQCIYVAEKTGEMELVLLQAIRYYDYELKKRIEKIESFLQPIMLSVVGGILGWVMFSILGAIYQSLERLPV